MLQANADRLSVAAATDEMHNC